MTIKADASFRYVQNHDDVGNLWMRAIDSLAISKEDGNQA